MFAFIVGMFNEFKALKKYYRVSKVNNADVQIEAHVIDMNKPFPIFELMEEFPEARELGKLLATTINTEGTPRIVLGQRMNELINKAIEHREISRYVDGIIAGIRIEDPSLISLISLEILGPSSS